VLSDKRFSRRAVLGSTIIGIAGAVSGASTASSSETTFTAAKDGNWSDPATWKNGSTPTDGSDVSIPAGVTVTIAGRITTRIKYLNVAGTLRHAPDQDSKLRVETIETESGSRYEIGTSSTPIQQRVTAQVEIIDEGPIDESVWPERKNKGLIAHGDVEIVGAEKTPWSTLAQAPAAGDSSIELSAEPNNWTPGDTVVVPGIEPYASASLDTEDEKRTISSISGTTVTFDSALDDDHSPPKSDFDTYALNLSRNVVFFSENTDEHRRGHVMIMNTGTDVRYVRFHEMGRTNKNEPFTNPVRNADTVDADDPNPAARYPFHYHHTGIEAEPHNAEGLVVQGGPGWGIVNHHAHAEITDSITYDVLGAGFVSEGGNERGVFDNCIAIRSEGSGETIDSRSAGAHGGDPPIDDFGHAGHGFWMQSPLVKITNCVAGGHRHQAFVWWLRPLLDGDLAEGTSIDDSRVTFHPNLPMEYLDGQEPLLEAIERGRFANGKNNDLMRDTRKIPSTFANIKEIRGNVAFGSAGGADFSRHNFKWNHERFSDFNAIEDMTVHSIGPFIDDDGVVHEPDPPAHLSSGHQGRGGNVGVSFRYTSNVTLKNSHLYGSGRENAFAVPFHDYLFTSTVDDSTIENWDYGVATGEHRLTWVRNNAFTGNNYDVNWSFDNSGPAVLEGNDLNLVRHRFQRINQKATEVFHFSQEYGLRIDGRSAHVEASAPGFVPFPDEDSLSGINNLDNVFDDPNATVGMTNAELMDEYGVAISGALLPDDAVTESFVEGSLLDPEGGRNPATSVYLDSVDADSLGAFEVVSEPDTAGGECLRWTGSSAPKDDPASITFDCASGTYAIYARVRPDAWNGDSVYFRIDGGTWKEAEKLKSPVGFEWHDASPNGGDDYEWQLSEGTHTLELACDNDDVLVDEIFLGSDQEVLGAYGKSTRNDDSTGNTAPDTSDDTASVANGETVTIDVLANDSDSDGSLDASTVTVARSASHGTTTVNDDGTIDYTHDGSDTASDSFTYTVEDDDGATSNEATVSISTGKTVAVTGDGAASHNDGTTVRYIIKTSGTITAGDTEDLEADDRDGGAEAAGRVPADGSDTDTYALVGGEVTDVSTWGGDVTVTVDDTTWSG